jgi:hypothetical protein
MKKAISKDIVKQLAQKFVGKSLSSISPQTKVQWYPCGTLSLLLKELKFSALRGKTMD